MIMTFSSLDVHGNNNFVLGCRSMKMVDRYNKGIICVIVFMVHVAMEWL